MRQLADALAAHMCLVRPSASEVTPHASKTCESPAHRPLCRTHGDSYKEFPSLFLVSTAFLRLRLEASCRFVGRILPQRAFSRSPTECFGLVRVDVEDFLRVFPPPISSSWVTRPPNPRQPSCFHPSFPRWLFLLSHGLLLVGGEGRPCGSWRERVG